MKLLDLRYPHLLDANLSFEGDGVDYFDYCLEIKEYDSNSDGEKEHIATHSYKLHGADIEDLIEGLETFTAKLKKAYAG